MPNVIDSLILEIGIDPSKFTRGQKDALDSLRKFQDQAVRSGKDVESQNKKTVDFFSNLKREALSTLALFMGGKGIKDFTNYITSADAATGRMAKTLGISTRELSAWQGAIKQIGGSAESATEGISGLNDAVQSFTLTGELPALRVFNALGVSLYDQNHQLKNAGDLWLDLSRAVEGFDPVRATAFLKMIPGANQDMINFALQGPRAMRSYLQAAREAGVATAESSKAAQDYQASLSKLDASATNLGRTLVTTLTPALTSAFDSLQKLFSGWNVTPGTPEAAKIERGMESNLRRRFGRPPEWLRNLLGLSESDYDETPAAKAAPSSSAIPIKPGAGASSPATRGVMDALSSLQGINRVTSLNDAYHTTGAHAAGNGIDVTIKDPSQSAAMTEAIKAKLAELGLRANVLNEYLNPSARATGGHIHIGVIPQAGFVPGAPAAASISNVMNSNAIGGSQSTATTNIGTIVIHAEGNDAEGIAQGIGPALRRNGLISPANFGQQ